MSHSLDLLTRWTENSIINNLRLLMESGNYIMYFNFKGGIFGTSENGRMTFAKMKDKGDEDHNKGWLQEANFTASDLMELLRGRENQRIFGIKELPDVKILNKEEVEKSIAKLLK